MTAVDLSQTCRTGARVGAHVDARPDAAAADCGCGDACALAELGQGECAVVHASGAADGDTALLKAMGLRPEARVRVCRRGEPCIVEIDGAGGAGRRVGLAKAIALRVMVRREAVGVMLDAERAVGVAP